LPIASIPDGSLDMTLGTGGRFTVDVSTKTDSARSLVLQSDGKIVLGGYYSDANQQSQFAVVRLKTDGSTRRSAIRASPGIYSPVTRWYQ
jgi:uncharacterized protein YdgA (DUF945 family)